MGDILSIVLKRLGLGLITLLVISIIIFGAVELLPGDIAQAVLGQGATEQNLAALREQLGLNRAAPIRYFEWLGNAVTGDFGTSLVSQNIGNGSDHHTLCQHPVSGCLRCRDRGSYRHHAGCAGCIVPQLGF